MVNGIITGSTAALNRIRDNVAGSIVHERPQQAARLVRVAHGALSSAEPVRVPIAARILLVCDKSVRAWAKDGLLNLIGRGRLESFSAEDLDTLASVLVGRALRRVQTTAVAALGGGDVDGAYVAAYDAYQMATESLLARQGLRAAGGDGSHMAVGDAVSAQFAADIPEFAKPTFERFRRTRHSAQYLPRIVNYTRCR